MDLATPGNTTPPTIKLFLYPKSSCTSPQHNKLRQDGWPRAAFVFVSTLALTNITEKLTAHESKEIGQDVVAILVGPDKTPFIAHQDLLTSTSPYFKAAFEGKFREASDSTIHLADINTVAFKLFLDWAYFKCIPKQTFRRPGKVDCSHCKPFGANCEEQSQKRAEDEPRGFPDLSDDEDKRLENVITNGQWYNIKLYILADRYNVLCLRRAILDQYWTSWSNGGNLAIAPLIWALRNLPFNSVFYSLLVDTYVENYDLSRDKNCRTAILLRQNCPPNSSSPSWLISRRWTSRPTTQEKLSRISAPTTNTHKTKSQSRHAQAPKKYESRRTYSGSYTVRISTTIHQDPSNFLLLVMSQHWPRHSQYHFIASVSDARTDPNQKYFRRSGGKNRDDQADGPWWSTAPSGHGKLVKEFGPTSLAFPKTKSQKSNLPTLLNSCYISRPKAPSTMARLLMRSENYSTHIHYHCILLLPLTVDVLLTSPSILLPASPFNKRANQLNTLKAPKFRLNFLRDQEPKLPESSRYLIRIFNTF